jgi:hypothetical protein
MTHRAVLVLFYWAFRPGSGKRAHVAAPRSQSVSGPAARGDEGLCGGSVRAFGGARGAPARTGGGGREGGLHHRVEGADREAGRSGSGLSARQVRAEIRKAGPRAAGTGAGSRAIVRHWSEDNGEGKPPLPRRRPRSPLSRTGSRPASRPRRSASPARRARHVPCRKACRTSSG